MTTSARTVAVLTVSDGCFQGIRVDTAGPAVEEALVRAGFSVLPRTVVPDDVARIVAALKIAVEQAALVITTGGTGLALRDVTPEATQLVCTRLVPGLSEKMRTDGQIQTPWAALSRGVCGTAPNDNGEAALVLNLPGNPEGAVFSLQSILPLLPHALDLLAGKTSHAK